MKHDYDIIINQRGVTAMSHGTLDKIGKLYIRKPTDDDYTIITAANGKSYRISKADMDDSKSAAEINKFFDKIAKM